MQAQQPKRNQSGRPRFIAHVAIAEVMLMRYIAMLREVAYGDSVRPAAACTAAGQASRHAKKV